MPRRFRDQGKRQWVDEEDEYTVDDLAHAATFAMMTMVPDPTNSLNTHHGGTVSVSHSDQAITSLEATEMKNEDQDDIELEESSADDADNDDNDVEENIENNQLGEEVDDDDEDDQSEVDLVEELAKMEDDQALDDDDDDDYNDVDKDNRGNKIPRPPKTENELDAYRTPIHELEKHLQFQLTVRPDESSVTTKHRRFTASDLQMAGRIKHYMAMDRTVVVESSVENPHGGMSSFKHHNAPLDEGTLLFVRFPQNGQEGSTSDEELTPLGRIFEVFGPVSKPLYTIRLPAKPITTSRSKPSKASVAQSVESCTAETKPLQKLEEGGVKSEPTSQHNGTTTEDSSTSNHVQSAQVETNQSLTLGEHGTTITQNVTTSADATTSDATDNASIAIKTQDEQDDWAPEGKYAKLLQQNPSTPVYYVKDEAKVIDTGFILRLSGKGCDASNLYDEEVVNTSEMYYSDDEEERQAKNRRKSKSKGPQQQEEIESRNPPVNNQYSLPSGFHHNAAPCNQRSYSAHQSMPLPSGFYPPQPPQPGRRYDVPTSSYPAISRGVGGPPPPPPPASGGMNPPPAYRY